MSKPISEHVAPKKSFSYSENLSTLLWSSVSSEYQHRVKAVSNIHKIQMCCNIRAVFHSSPGISQIIDAWLMAMQSANSPGM